MKKVLFVATITKHINTFHIPYLKWFKEQGYEVHVASRGNEPIKYCDKHYEIPFERFPLKISNIRAYKQLKKIIDENKYEIIHCHTPVGGALTRLASRKARKNSTRVIYTAHGFHFYNGAPIKNWILYYPIEKFLSRYTDCLITINQEDYCRAIRKFKRCKQIELVNGVGVDINKFDFEMSEEQKDKIRNQFKIKKEDYILISIGELNKNKNQIMQVEAMKYLVKENPKMKLLIIGKGEKEDFLKKKIRKYSLKNNVVLAGYRKDVPCMLKISNCLLSTSKREGLPVNVMEAMSCGLPVIATDCRGNRDLIKNGLNGFIINDSKSLYEQILKIMNEKELSRSFQKNAKEISKEYDINKVKEDVKIIYG